MSSCSPHLGVVAIGGNSLAKDPHHQTIRDQLDAVRATSAQIAKLIARGWRVVVTHGNGPQVGFVMRRSEIACEVEGLHEVPLDVCGADTQGATGYLIQQSLRNELCMLGLHTNVATIVTQSEVALNDAEFASPSKPIGSFMSEERAIEQRDRNAWTVSEDAGRGWRRVVPSPAPQRIIELPMIAALLERGDCVVAVGGGGIPVAVDDCGLLQGVSAVVDKDHASSLLASSIGASTFIICTAIDRVALNFGTPRQEWLDRVTLQEAKAYLAEGTHFAKGSMAPKISAAIRFLEQGGHRAVITTPERLVDALEGRSGTTVSP